jgi:hypothetical protein
MLSSYEPLSLPELFTVTEGEPFALPYFTQLDVEPVFVDVSVTAKAHGHEIQFAVVTATAAVLDVMELKAILARGSARLALIVVAFENCAINRRRDVLGLFSREVAIAVDDATHQYSSSRSLSGRVLFALERSRFDTSSSSS